MQTITSKNVRKGGRPFAATTNAPRANGSAKIVWEKRIKRRNLDTGPPDRIASFCRSFASTANHIKGKLPSNSRRRLLPPDKIGVPCPKRIRSASKSKSFCNDRRISFSLEQYLPGRK